MRRRPHPQRQSKLRGGNVSKTSSLSVAHSFNTLNAIDVSSMTESKNGFTYLSWAHALRVLQEYYPKATWDIKRFEGMPFLKTELGYFVEVGVTVEGRELTQLHPVLDHRNKPIAKPTTFEINKSIQRCLAKAISLHGLGLYIYAGEDLPTQPAVSQQPVSIEASSDEVNAFVAECDKQNIALDAVLSYAIDKQYIKATGMDDLMQNDVQVLMTILHKRKEKQKQKKEVSNDTDTES